MQLNLTLAITASVALGAASAWPSDAQAQVQTMPACQVENPPANCGQGNMWAVDSIVGVPNGAYVHTPNPGCMTDAQGRINQVLQAATVAAMPGLALFSGPIAALGTGPVNNYLRNQGGDIGRYFSPYARDGALCAPVAVIVPKDAQVLGYRLMAGEASGGFGGCAPGADCGIGWSKFQAEPVVQRNEAMQAVTTIFMNWSHNRQRKARMIIFYRMPQGQQPLTQM